MKISRRAFLKLSGGAALSGTALIGEKGVAEAAYPSPDKLKGAKITTTICPYCAVGCGFRVYSKNGKVIHIEGDPDHPINEGKCCPKGAGLYQFVNNDTRVLKPLYRAPGADKWKEVEWDWALNRIARLIKEARDKTFVHKNSKGQVVNRTDGIAHVGSAAIDNEECYLLQKWLRSIGLVYIEHQARI